MLFLLLFLLHFLPMFLRQFTPVFLVHFAPGFSVLKTGVQEHSSLGRTSLIPGVKQTRLPAQKSTSLQIEKIRIRA